MYACMRVVCGRDSLVNYWPSVQCEIMGISPQYVTCPCSSDRKCCVTHFLHMATLHSNRSHMENALSRVLAHYHVIVYGLAKKRLRCTFVRNKFGEERPFLTRDMSCSFQVCRLNRVDRRLDCHTPEVFGDSCSRPQTGWMNEERATSESELCLFFPWKLHGLQVYQYFIHYCL